MSLLLIILLIVLLGGGGWGYTTYPAYRGGISIIGLILIILVIYLLLGHSRFLGP